MLLNGIRALLYIKLKTQRESEHLSKKEAREPVLVHVLVLRPAESSFDLEVNVNALWSTLLLCHLDLMGGSEEARGDGEPCG